MTDAAEVLTGLPENPISAQRMQLGIDRAVAAGIPVEYRSLGNG
jgi:hypothetical protein